LILDLDPRLRGRGEKMGTPRVFDDPNKVVRGYRYDMAQYLDKAVDKYCALANVEREKLRIYATPFIDESQDPSGSIEAESTAEDQVRGQLASIACSVIMTLMFCCRLARYELLRATANLATFLHKWTANTDKKLNRLMGYVKGHLSDMTIGFVGDKLDDLWLALFADADFAGDKQGSKSTGGAFLILMGPYTFFPLTAHSKKQGSTANSSTEAEIVSLAHALRTIGIPALDLWEELLGRKVKLVIYEDNQATATIAKTGMFYKSMGHVKRCHGVQLQTITERLRDETFTLEDCHTECMAADIFTKHFVDQKKWQHAITLIGVLSPQQQKSLLSNTPVPTCSGLKALPFQPCERPGAAGDPTPPCTESVQFCPIKLIKGSITQAQVCDICRGFFSIPTLVCRSASLLKPPRRSPPASIAAMPPKGKGKDREVPSGSKGKDREVPKGDWTYNRDLRGQGRWKNQNPTIGADVAAGCFATVNKSVIDAAYPVTNKKANKNREVPDAPGELLSDAEIAIADAELLENLKVEDNRARVRAVLKVLNPGVEGMHVKAGLPLYDDDAMRKFLVDSGGFWGKYYETHPLPTGAELKARIEEGLVRSGTNIFLLTDSTGNTYFHEAKDHPRLEAEAGYYGKKNSNGNRKSHYTKWRTWQLKLMRTTCIASLLSSPQGGTSMCQHMAEPLRRS